MRYPTSLGNRRLFFFSFSDHYTPTLNNLSNPSTVVDLNRVVTPHAFLLLDCRLPFDLFYATLNYRWVS